MRFLLINLSVILALVVFVICGCRKRCICTRKTIRCSYAQLNDLPEGQMNITEYVVVRYDNVRELSAEMFQRRGLVALVVFTLSYTMTEEIHPGAFKDLIHLRELTISYNELQAIHPTTFEYLHRLVKLDLYHNKIHTIHSGIFNGMSFLRYLDLSSNKIKTLPLDVFRGMQQLNNSGLTDDEIRDITLFISQETGNVLNLSANEFIYIEPGTFQGLWMFKKLYLYANRIKILHNNTFRGLENMETLDMGPTSKFETVSPGLFDGVEKLRTIIIATDSKLRFRKELDRLNGNAYYMEPRLCIFGIELNAMNTLVAVPPESLNKLQYFTDIVLYGDYNGYLTRESFQRQKDFKTLGLYDHNIEKLKDNMFKEFSQLRQLFLANNGIETIETGAFNGIGMLKTLDLSTNKITHISKYVFHNLKRIDEIDLTWSPILVIDSKSINSFQVMKAIRIGVTDLDGFHKEISSSIKNVQHLSISSVNNITDLGSFGTLELMSLSVVSSEIKVLTQKILHGLSKLKSLSLDNVSIMEIIPGTFTSFKDLEMLSLSNNDITSLDNCVFVGLTGLLILNLSTNRLTKIERGVFGAPFNHSCNILYNQTYQNHCSIILNQPLPEKANCTVSLTSKGLASLQELDLRANRIAYIHPDAFEGNLNLQTLILNDNKRIKVLDSVVIPSLRYLDVHSCGILNSSSLFENFPRIETIDISHNKIQILNFDLLRGLKHLRQIQIFHNPIICDCEFYKTWTWLKEHNVEINYLFSDFSVEDELSFENSCKHFYNPNFNFVNDTQDCYNVDIEHEVVNAENEDNNLLIFKYYIEPIVLGFIFVTGALGNILLLIIFGRHSEMRTGPNVCIINLTLGDLLSLVFNLPVSYADNSSRTWIFGLALCKAFMFLKDLTVGITVFSVVALSIQRYSVIVRSLQSRTRSCKLPDHFKSLVYISSVWVLSVSFALPAAFTATVEDRCMYAPTTYDKEYMRRTWTIQFFLYCVIPICIILYMYAMMARHLVKSVQNMPGETRATLQARGRTRVASTVVWLTVVFCISYVPNFLIRVLVIWSIVDYSAHLTTYASFISYCLFFCSTCLNPLALFYMSSAFRKYFLRYVFFWRSETQTTADNVQPKRRIDQNAETRM